MSEVPNMFIMKDLMLVGVHKLEAWECIRFEKYC